MAVRKSIWVTVACLAVLLSGCPPELPPNPPRDYDPALLGVWAGSFYEPTTGETYTIKVGFQDESFEIRLDKFDKLLWAGDYVVYLEPSPNHIDLFVDYAANEYGIVRPVDQFYLGLYELQGDTILFSLGPMDGERPASIEEGTFVFEGALDDSRFAFPPWFFEGEPFPEGEY